MAGVPASSHGGETSPNVSAAAVLQTGGASPLNVVTPVGGRGALYQSTDGCFYAGDGPTSASWVSIGGNGDLDVPGVYAEAAGRVTIVGSGGAGYVLLTDLAALASGHGNGLKWISATDDTQNMQLKVGGSFVHTWQADGAYVLPVACNAADQAPQLGQVSPKFTITSGALPTAAFVSGTARQCHVSRDVTLVVPFTGDATNNAATLLIQVSPDNVTFSTLDTLSIAAALNLTGAINVPVTLGVPAAWYVKLTATHGAIGTGTYY